MHLQHTGSEPASSAGWDTLAIAVRTRIELALGGRQPPRFPDAYRTRTCVSPGRFELPARPSEGCVRSARRGGRRVVAPGAGFEPAVRRLTAVRVASFATPVCRVKQKSGRAGRATPWGNTGPTHAVSSTARESNPARRFGRPGPSRSDSGTNAERNGAASGNCPHASDLASRRASHNTLAAMELRAGLAPACDEVAARRLTVRSTGAGEETARIERARPWSTSA